MPVYVDSLSRIIDFVEQLAAADTAASSPWPTPSPTRCSGCVPTP
jgi:Asp-tRNA(Asn)/Glu-tRNA(Gln) amidotransferase C subunit